LSNRAPAGPLPTRARTPRSDTRIRTCLAALRGISIAAILSLATGCVSIEHLAEDEQVEIYGGVQKSWNYIQDLENPVMGRAVRTLDFPLTLVFDTLILPVTVPIVLLR